MAKVCASKAKGKRPVRRKGKSEEESSSNEAVSSVSQEEKTSKSDAEVSQKSSEGDDGDETSALGDEARKLPPPSDRELQPVTDIQVLATTVFAIETKLEKMLAAMDSWNVKINDMGRDLRGYREDDEKSRQEMLNELNQVNIRHESSVTHTEEKMRELRKAVLGVGEKVADIGLRIDGSTRPPSSSPRRTEISIDSTSVETLINTDDGTEVMHSDPERREFEAWKAKKEAKRRAVLLRAPASKDKELSRRDTVFRTRSVKKDRIETDKGTCVVPSTVIAGNLRREIENQEIERWQKIQAEDKSNREAGLNLLKLLKTRETVKPRPELKLSKFNKEMTEKQGFAEWYRTFKTDMETNRVDDETGVIHYLRMQVENSCWNPWWDELDSSQRGNLLLILETLLNRYGKVMNSESESFKFEKLTLDQCYNLEDYINKKTTCWKQWKKYAKISEPWDSSEHFKTAFLRGLDKRYLRIATKSNLAEVKEIIERLREEASMQDKINAVIEAQKEYSGSAYKGGAGKAKTNQATTGEPKKDGDSTRGRSRKRRSPPKGKVARVESERICWNVLKTGDCKYKDNCRFAKSHAEASERWKKGENSIPTIAPSGNSKGRRSKSRFRTGEDIECRTHTGAKHDARRCPETECYYCGGKGHMSMVCQKQFCKTCGKHGHSSQGHEWAIKNP
jgi:hypothetical protein